MEHNLKSFLTFLLEEVVKADMTMQERQLDLWKHFAAYKPKGEFINEDIDKGWAESNYLTLGEVSFTFHVQSIPQNFFKRFGQGVNYIFGKYKPQAFQPAKYVITESENPESIEVKVKIRQEERGAIQVSYEPVDADTKEIFLTSPFLHTAKKF